jgi:CheY-like chemotaxis protein
MTASVTKERVEECFEAGMNDYMMKPFSPDVLREKVIRNING